MICTPTLPSRRNRTVQRVAVQERQGYSPIALQTSDTPLLDWIAGELRGAEGQPEPEHHDQARRILGQAFAAVA